MENIVFYQHYWWFLVSLLGALLVFLFFVQGRQLLIYQIGKKERGNSAFVINGRSYSAGMYLYSLIADNQVIDTKRMILTK